MQGILSKDSDFVNSSVSVDLLCFITSCRSTIKCLGESSRFSSCQLIKGFFLFLDSGNKEAVPGLIDTRLSTLLFIFVLGAEMQLLAIIKTLDM